MASATGSSPRIDFQTSRGACSRRESQDSSVGGSSCCIGRFYRARGDRTPTGFKEGTRGRRGNASSQPVARVRTFCRAEGEENRFPPRASPRNEVARGRKGTVGETQEGGRHIATRTTDSAQPCFGGPEVVGIGCSTPDRESRVAEATIARRLCLCFRRGADSMDRRSSERHERCSESRECRRGGQDSGSIERRHHPIKAVDRATVCRSRSCLPRHTNVGFDRRCAKRRCLESS